MLVSINENDSLPIYLQIARQIKEQVLVGELTVGDELPSVRELGDALGISLHTARNAYQSLSDAGLLQIRLGKKARIADLDLVSRPTNAQLLKLREDARDLVVDAMLSGMGAKDVHEMMDEEMDKLRLRSDEVPPGARGRGK